MIGQNQFSLKGSLKYDAPASLVVFLVSVPLCLGIALASGAPLFSGIISGIVGGLIVAPISNSQLGVSGPAAGLAIIVLTAIQDLGSYEAFLPAIILSGVIQLILGMLRTGIIGYYFPSSVIKGMLSGIGIIIILKQIPHAFGYDADFEGDITFLQADGENTFSELVNMFDFISAGAIIITIVSIIILILWERPFIKKQGFSKIIPGPLVAVAAGIGMNLMFRNIPGLALKPSHLVSLPVADSLNSFIGHFYLPDFSFFGNKQTYTLAFTIAIVGSLETLLSLEAIDKIDPYKRISSANRELKAQGIGNIVAGLIGGLPITQVIVRSSANMQSGGRTKMAAFLHGLWILLAALIIPRVLNLTPLASLAAILILVGYKLTKPIVFKSIYKLGKSQFIPFVITIIGFIFTDLLVGVGLGLMVAAFFILFNNYKYPYYFNLHDYHKGEIIKIELAEQVSFLNKAGIMDTLNHLPDNSHIVIDASRSKYIHPDILEIFDDFKPNAELRNIKAEFLNFPKESHPNPVEQFTKIIQMKKTQAAITPAEAIQMLKDGNARFVSESMKSRNLVKQVKHTAGGQYPFAAILGCIDSRVTAELIFDQGIGDIFSVSVAGNLVNTDIIGSLEYACKVAGAKAIVVVGHTNCGAIKGACDDVQLGNLSSLLEKLKPVIEETKGDFADRSSANIKFVQKVTERNVINSIKEIKKNSTILSEMLEKKEIAIEGAMYDVNTGKVNFL